MSAEEAVAETLQTSVDQNEQAAEDAKKLLAELQNEAAPSIDTKQTNGAEEAVKVDDKANKKTEGEAEDKAEIKTGDSEPSRENRHHGRSEQHGRGRGRGRGDRNGHVPRNYRDNIKSDVTTQEESSDPVAIRKQVEFYFSDSNLPNDKFLLSEVGGSENNAVAIETIHQFKRMRHFQPLSAIVEALRESTFLELTEDDTKIRRREPLPDSEYTVYEDRAMPRSIYAKGFGDELPSTQFDIEAFFDPYGPTNAVRLRRSNEKLFKGSVFVEFETEALAQAFLALDPKPKYKGNDLQIMSKKEYCGKKVEDLKAGKIKPNSRYEKGGRDNRRGDRRDNGNHKRTDEDSRDWRTRRDEDRKRGFRDDKRRGGNRPHRGGGHGGGRSNGPVTDEKGIPTVKATPPKRDGGRDDALAKARAAVEAEKKRETNEKSAETAENKKRGREDDGEADAQRETKKVDTKVEATATS